MADYRHEEVYYDRIKTGSPFSVLRSPFSVLRSPFSVLRSPFSVSSLLLVLIFLFGLVSCGGDGSTSIRYGTLTVENIPAPYELAHCRINTNANVPWNNIPNIGMMHGLPDAEYYPNINGAGFRDSLDRTQNTYNKITLYGTKFHLDEKEGAWTPDGNPVSDFTFTGKASVWAIFSRKDPQKAVYVGYNNVQFNGGNAVINYNASSFTIPKTNGMFTLTDIPAAHHNKKYAILIGAYGNPPTALYGLKDATSATAFKGYPITEETAEIPVFKLDTVTMQFSSFDEDPSVTSLVIIIQDEEEFDFLEYSEALSKWDGIPQNYPLSGLVYTNVPFTKGKASIAYDPAKAVGGLE